MGFHGMGGGMSAYLEEQQNRGRKTDARTLRRVATAFKPYIPQVVLVLIAILFTTLLGLVNPLLIQRIFDDAIGARNTSASYSLRDYYDCHAYHLRLYRGWSIVSQ